MNARPNFSGFDDAKPRKPKPHQFVLDTLLPLDVQARPMFGCLAIYLGGKIVLILRDKAGADEDNGVWLATTPLHHASLLREFPNMRHIQMFGHAASSWQLLPSDAPDFEESALRACELIAARDPRIGKVPKPRRKKRKLQGR